MAKGSRGGKRKSRTVGAKVIETMNGLPVYNRVPAGWKLFDAQNAPRGYEMISNGKSVFSPEYKHAYIKRR